MKAVRWAISGGVALLALTGCGRHKNGAGDTDDIGTHASMVLDQEGRVLVASYHKTHKVSENRDEAVGSLTFSIGKVKNDGSVRFGDAKRVDGDERIEGQSNVGLYTSIAVGKDGFARISYYDKDHGDLKYATQVGGKWEIEVVDQTGNVGGWTSLALENDQPRIAYYDFDNGDLKFAAKVNGAWQVSVVDANVADVGRFASIASDNNGGLAIAYYDATNADLVYTSGNVSGFGAPELIDTNGDVGRWPSLAFDLGSPRLSYHDYANQDLKLAKRDGGGAWQIEIVDAGEWVGADSSIAIDRGGRITIAYFDGLNNDLLSAKWDGTAWVLSKIAEAGANGYFNTVLMNADDKPIFGWYSFTGTEFVAQQPSSPAASAAYSGDGKSL